MSYIYPLLSTRWAASFLMLSALLLMSARPGLAQNGLVIPTAENGAQSSVDVDGLCVGCSTNDVSAVVDASLSNYTTLSVPLAVGGGLSLSVSFGEEQPGGSVAGFAIESLVGLADVELLNTLTVQTFANGSLQEEFDDSDLLDIQVLAGGDARIVSFPTILDFDEVRLSIEALATVASDVAVYYAFAASSLSEDFVLLESENGVTVSVGTDGDCTGCSVLGAGELLDDLLISPTSVSVSAGTSGTIYLDVSLTDAAVAGTDVGFALANLEGLMGSELIASLSIETYLDETFQESMSGADLDLTVLGGLVSGVSLNATLPFDRVRLRVSALADGSMDHGLYLFFAYVSAGVTTSTEAGPAERDLAVAMAPNPAVGQSQVLLTVDEAGLARAELFDLLGRRVAVLHEGALSAGTTALELDAGAYPAGLYVLRVVRGESASTRTVTLLGR